LIIKCEGKSKERRGIGGGSRNIPPFYSRREKKKRERKLRPCGSELTIRERKGRKGVKRGRGGRGARRFFFASSPAAL